MDMVQVRTMREADLLVLEAGDVGVRLRTPPYAAYSRHSRGTRHDFMSSPDRLEPSFYHHWIGDRVRFADLDPLGHCNNAAIGGFFESSRIALFADAGHPVSGGALSIPIVRVEIDFRHEILYRSLTAIAARQLPKSSPSCSI